MYGVPIIVSKNRVLPAGLYSPGKKILDVAFFPPQLLSFKLKFDENEYLYIENKQTSREQLLLEE